MEKMECNPESSDSSMSENSDDDIDNEKELAKISVYKKQIEENELCYDAHMGLIQAFRNMGEMEELRKARQGMNKVYPLSPDLWMDWLSDEQKICTSEEEREFICELFKKAVKEYMSVQIWVEFIMFMLGRGKMEATRQVYEDALTAVGIHLAEGILVWQAVLLVEQQFFLNLPPDNNKEIEGQKKKVQGIFRRQARVPLMNLDKGEFLSEANKWFEEVDPQIKKDLDNNYRKMMEKLTFEEALLRASDETEKLEAYRRYIDFVRKSDNPAVIQNMYERTVTDLCLNAGMWEEYVRFVMDQFSSADYIILPVCQRSQANCPWSSVLFELHISSLQTFSHTLAKGETKKKITGILRKTLGKNVLSEVEAVRVWLAYLVYLRREIKWQDESAESQLTEFQDACNDAITFIDKRFGEEGDKECTIARFQARILAELANDMEAARAIWNDHIMKRNNNFKVAVLWIEFINVERSYGDEKHCRKLYRRSLERVWDNVEVIGSSFLQFEQELGTLETMMDFEKRYRDRLSIVQKKRMQDAMKEESKSVYAGKGKGKTKQEAAVKQQQKISPNVKQQPQDWKSETYASPSKSSRGTKRSSSPLGVAPPPGYKPAQDDVETTNKKQRVEGRGEFVSHDPASDHRTVFLSNMDFNAPEGEVRAVFSECGEVDNFRLAKDFRGRSKGFGYLVFKDAASVPRALEKDRTPVGQRPLFVSRCNPKTRDPTFKFSTRTEKEKLFVKGLPFSMSEEEVKSAFAPHGDIKSIRLVTHRNGFSKGTCYIEFLDAKTAESVRQQMDGTVLKEHTISVYISNPAEAKGKTGSAFSLSALTPSNVDSRGARQSTQRAKLNFVPRALLRKTEGVNGQDSTASTTPDGNERKENGATDSNPKSNADFRKMFLS